MLGQPPSRILFPYPTLFRSVRPPNNSARSSASDGTAWTPSASACCPSRKVRFWCDRHTMNRGGSMLHCVVKPTRQPSGPGAVRSEEHTSELQSHVKLVCRLL